MREGERLQKECAFLLRQAGWRSNNLPPDYERWRAGEKRVWLTIGEALCQLRQSKRISRKL